MNTEIVNDWTPQELRREVLIWTGIELSNTQFYAWLRAAMIDRNRIYTERDRYKLMNFSRYMLRYRRLETAKAKLIEHLQQNEALYPC